MISRNEKQIPSEDAPLMAFVAEFGVVPKGDRYDRSFLVKSDAKLYKRTELNDFIYSSNNLDVGSIGLNKYGTAVISDVYEIFSIKQPNNSTFISELIQRPSCVNKILKYRQGCLYGQYRIYAEDFLNVDVMLPHVGEQEKIASFIELIDSKIDKQRQLIELLKKYKRGIMSSHFAQVENSTSAINTLLSDDCIFFSGGTPKSTDKSLYEGKIPFIRSGEIHKDKTELFINEEAIKKSSAKMINKGDLLLAMYGATSGEVSISQIDGAINQAILCIRPRSINVNYLKNLLEYNKNMIVSTYIQGGQGNLSAEIIKNLTFKIPPKRDQKFFNSCISKIEIRIEKAEKNLVLFYKYKKGLLQQLFI